MSFSPIITLIEFSWFFSTGSREAGHGGEWSSRRLTRNLIGAKKTCHQVFRRPTSLWRRNNVKELLIFFRSSNEGCHVALLYFLMSWVTYEMFAAISSPPNSSLRFLWTTFVCLCYQIYRYLIKVYHNLHRIITNCADTWLKDYASQCARITAL